MECLDRDRETGRLNDRRRKSYFSRLECTKSRSWERFARIHPHTAERGREGGFRALENRILGHQPLEAGGHGGDWESRMGMVRMERDKSERVGTCLGRFGEFERLACDGQNFCSDNQEEVKMYELLKLLNNNLQLPRAYSRSLIH